MVRKAVVTGYIAVVDMEWPLMKVIITLFTFCLWWPVEKKFVALEKPGKLWEFFHLLCGHFYGKTDAGEF